MKAAVHSKYGLPGDLRIKDIDIPTPKDDELLVKVYATTVNRSDCHVLSGRPLVMRLFTGLFKPRSPITGSDFAGQIEMIGSKVQSFRVGDKVMGFGGGLGCGSHAQYFIFPERKAMKAMVLMPATLTYEGAAASMEGAFYAASVVTQLNVKPGQKALVFGATGAIGSAYVQFLKYYGAWVTAVCGGENSELVRLLGADRIIDYKTADFTTDNDKYDFVFDAIGRSSFSKCMRLLNKKGKYTSSGGAENLLLVLVTPLFGGRKVVFPMAKSYRGVLNFIKDQIEKGTFHSVIDRRYPLERISEAYTYVASGQKIGNVIITMNAGEPS